MKKLALTIAFVLALCIASFAQSQRGGGLFQYGWVADEEYYGAEGYNFDRPTGTGFSLLLPTTHNTTNDYNAPLGSGALLLIGFGAAYALRKKSSKR